MKKVKLGRTQLSVSRVGFGAIPIQRISFDEAKLILQKAYDNGVNFFDTARAYTDSEAKIAYALGHYRKNIIIATKTQAKKKKELLKDIETSLKMLATDYIDVYQLHNPDSVPDSNDSEGMYETLLDLKTKGVIRHIGITSHTLDNAREAINSGLFDTVQYPLNILSSPGELQLIEKCQENNIGLIAMKALSGGLITNATAAYAFLSQFSNLVPIWGIEKESELDEFISFEKNPPHLNEELNKIIQKDRDELAGDFCRGCGYCMPCPVEIPISTAARMSHLLRRQSPEIYLTEDWKKRMEKVEFCLECGECISKCPYKLDTPALLKKMLKDYRQFYKNNI